MANTSKTTALGRKGEHRKALLVNQSNSLLQHKRMITTLAKAKALAPFIAPIITHARTRMQTNVHHAYQQAFSILRNKKGIHELFNQVLPQIKERPGGYTRILKLGTRKGDAAAMALIELVDFNTLFQKAKKVRTRRGKRKYASGTSLFQKKNVDQKEASVEDAKT